MSIYVENVSGQDEHEQIPLEVPILNFQCIDDDEPQQSAGPPTYRDYGEQEALPLPSLNFRRSDGQDVGSDGHNADGRTPGSPGVPRFVDSAWDGQGIPGRRHAGNGDWLDSRGSDGKLPTDPRPNIQRRPSTATRRPTPVHRDDAATFQPTPPAIADTVVCPSCGEEFSAMEQAPLVLPTMNAAMRKMVGPDDDVDTDRAPFGGEDNEPAGGTYCPRCGSRVDFRS